MLVEHRVQRVRVSRLGKRGSVEEGIDRLLGVWSGKVHLLNENADIFVFHLKNEVWCVECR